MPPIDKPLDELTPDEKLDLILITLKGNPLNSKDGGILGIQSWHNARLTKLEKSFARAVAWMAGAVAVGTAAVGVFVFLFNHFKK